MRRWWIALALFVSLAGCPEKKSDQPTGKPDSGNQPTTPSSGPVSPANPLR